MFDLEEIKHLRRQSILPPQNHRQANTVEREVPVLDRSRDATALDLWRFGCRLLEQL
jgi:hypothetical protein